MKLKEPYLLCPVCGKIVAEYRIVGNEIQTIVSDATDKSHLRNGGDGPDYLFDDYGSIACPELPKVHRVGETVVVADPKSPDKLWRWSFQGHITDILDNGNYIIEDGDSDFYEVEPDELED